MATVDTLLVEIKADMNDLRKKLNQAEKTVKQSTGNQKKDFLTLGNTIKGVIGGVIAVSIARFGSQMVQMASHIEEMRAKSSVVFGEFVGQVRTDLEEFGDAVGRSTFALEEMASSVQDTFVPLGFARDEASQLSVQLTKLAVDVASFNNAQDVPTMRAFQSALVGNHEAVRRFGIVITEAELKAELQRMGIEKNINLITAQEKVQARLNLIIAGTTDAQGDAERTADSFANSMKALSAEFDEFMAEAITPLLPALSDMVQSLKDGIIATKEFLREIGLIEEIRDIIPIVDQLAKAEENLAIKQEELAKKQKLLNAIQTFSKTQVLDQLIGKNKEFGASILLGEKFVQDQVDTLKAQIEVIKTNTGLITLDSEARGLNAKAIDAQTESIKKKKEAEASIILPTARPTKNANFINQIEAQAKAEEHLASILDGLKDIEKEKAEADEQLFKIAKDLVPQQNKFKAETEALSFALIEGKITLDEYNLAMADLKQKMFETTEEGKVAMKAIDGLSDGLANSLVEAVETGKFSLESLGNVVKNVMAEMARDFLKAQLRAMILKAVLASLGGGPAPAQFTGGGNLSGVGGYAGGGTVQRNRPVLVGERGPEIFVPNTGGTIKNNMDSNNMGGKTVVVNQNVNFTTGVVPTVRAEVINMLPIIKRETMNAVADAKQRGGSFAQALGSN